VFGYLAATARAGSLELFGHLLVLLAILFVTGMMWLVAPPRGNLDEHPASDVEFWSTEMLRQARLLRLVPFWYLGPFLPGFALLLWSSIQDRGALAAIHIAGVVAVFVVVERLNRTGASRLERLASSLKEEEASNATHSTP